MFQSVSTQVSAARKSLNLASERLRAHSRHVCNKYVVDLEERMAIASQAGDLTTLLSEQIKLVPASRRHPEGDVDSVRWILADLESDLRPSAYALLQGLVRDSGLTATVRNTE